MCERWERRTIRPPRAADRSRETHGVRVAARARLRASAALRFVLALLASIVTVEVAEAAFPGGNGKIAFLSGRDGNPEIYVMNPDGSGQTNLTNNPAFDGYPAWSPDGTRIAFSSDRGGYLSIYVMEAQGGGVARLTFDPAGDISPAWSPDGTKLAFSRTTGPFVTEIVVMNADGSGQSMKTSNGVLSGYPAWSPDGAKIAFSHGVFGGDSEVYVMNADGTGQTNLTNNPGALEHQPDWSPDGSKITYVGRPGVTNPELFVMNADGSSATRLTFTADGVTDTSPAWSPDGTKIAFVSDRAGDGEIYVMNAAGSNQTRITNDSAYDDQPDWQPLVAVPFAVFSPRVEIELGPLANDDRFEIKATFTLGAGSDGIAPLTEAVRVDIDGFSMTIPAGSFKQDRKGRFKFEGVIGGVELEAQIRPLGGGGFRFTAEGDGTDLEGISNPVTVGLEIGDDSGSALVTAEFEEVTEDAQSEAREQ